MVLPAFVRLIYSVIGSFGTKNPRFRRGTRKDTCAWGAGQGMGALKRLGSVKVKVVDDD